MTNLVKGAMIALGTSSTVAIPLSLHLTNQPSTFGEKLTWDGKSHLSQDDKDDHWKAKFNDYSKEIAGITKVGYSLGEVSDEHLKKLKQWCVDEAKKELSGNQGYETYSFLCSTDLKTLKGRMISEKLDLASTDDDWKLIFINNKHIESFTGKLSQHEGNPITSSTKIDDGHPKVKEICDRWFLESFDSRSYEEAKRRCVKSDVDTVEKKLNKLQGFKKIESDDDYEKMAKKWGKQDKFTNTISSSEGSEDKDKLKKYCSDNLSKKLISLSNYDEDIQKIRTFCDSSDLDKDSVKR